MTPLDLIFDRMAGAGDKIAVIEDGGPRISYADLLTEVDGQARLFSAAGIAPGSSVQLRGDFGRDGIAGLLALLRQGTIVTPVAPSSFEKADEFAEVAGASFIVDALEGRITPTGQTMRHPHFDTLTDQGHAGLVIFTSGTTGASKGAVHDATRLLGKFTTPGKDLVTLAFLLFDHIAGVDTLFYCLSNASTIVTTSNRAPENIARLMAETKTEVLPTAPSFLNLMLLSGAATPHDLSALKIITYGAETMPESLLQRLNQAFPGVRLIQKYGTSELGALKSRSEGSASLWLSIGTEGKDWRLGEDGLLEVRSKSTMLGYLNAPAPFTEDGWYRTGDRVETREDGLVRFLGRESDIINVGGQKVFPAEVENALKTIDMVAEAAVFGKPHPILGAVVCARIRLRGAALDPAAARALVRRELTGRLEPYKIPQKIELTTEALTTARFKQRRA